MSDNKDLVAAMEVVVTAMRSDPDYYRVWKDNIAMAFQDEYNRSSDRHDIHKIANDAADYFMKMLTK